jgi:hypothetical protein
MFGGNTMLKMLVSAIAAMALLTACGGSSSDTTEPSTATTSAPPPKVYSVDELKAALPGKSDIPDVLKVTYTCPGSGKPYCVKPAEGEEAGLGVELIPAGAHSSGDIEGASHDQITADAVYVDGAQHESEAAATKAVQLTRVANQKFDGAYDIKQKQEGKNITPAEKGTGTAKELSVDGWTGVISTHAGLFSFDGKSIQQQSTLLRVSNGATTITVGVAVGAKGRPADFADTLARKVLADYIGRLG